MNVVITGANRGIGLALCKQYLQKGANVIAVCRTASNELSGLEVEVIEGIDVSKSEDVSLLTDALKVRTVEILINNAGIYKTQTINSLDYDAMIEQFKVNTLGPIRVVEALLNNLTSGSKIGMITSRMGSVDDNTSGGGYGYRMSKCALNIAGKSLAVDLKLKGIAVALLHPGYVQTEMVNFNGDISAEVSAERLVQRMDELTLENSGVFWHSNGEVLPW